MRPAWASPPGTDGAQASTRRPSSTSRAVAAADGVEVPAVAVHEHHAGEGVGRAAQLHQHGGEGLGADREGAREPGVLTRGAVGDGRGDHDVGSGGGEGGDEGHRDAGVGVERAGGGRAARRCREGRRAPRAAVGHLRPRRSPEGTGHPPMVPRPHHPLAQYVASGVTNRTAARGSRAGVLVACRRLCAYVGPMAIRVVLAEDNLLVRAGVAGVLATASDIEVVGEAGDLGDVERLVAHARARRRGHRHPDAAHRHRRGHPPGRPPAGRASLRGRGGALPARGARLRPGPARRRAPTAGPTC